MATPLYPNGSRSSNKSVYTSGKPVPSGTRSVVHSTRRGPRAFDLDSLDDGEVALLVRRVAKEGDACVFSLTSDGGALCVTVLQGVVRHKCYASTVEEAYVKWTDLLETLY